MSIKDDLIGAKGGSSTFRNRPDNLRSTDTFEALIGLCSGRIKGLAPGGLQNLMVDDVPIEDGSGNTTLTDFNAILFDGDPSILQPIQLQLGGSSGAQNVNLPLNNPNQNEGTSNPGEWRYGTVPQSGVDYIDIRFIVNSLYRQDKKGIYDATASVEIELQPSGTSTWINPLQSVAAPKYNKNGVKLAGYSGVALYVLGSMYETDTTWYDTAPGFLQITGKTTTAYVKELRVAVPNTGTYANKTWQVRARLRERDSLTLDEKQESRSIQWESIAGVSMAPIGNREEWRGLSYLHVNGKASDQLQGVPTITGVYDLSMVRVPPASVWNAETRAYTGTSWDGATEEIQWTQCPAFQMKDLVEDGVSGISALVPGSSLNKWDVLEASKWFAQRVSDGQGGTHPRYSMNYILDSALSVNDLMQYVAGAVGSYAWDEGDGKWRLIVEKPENATALFTKENIVGEFNYSHTDVDTRYNDMIGVYRSEARGFDEDRVRVFDQVHIDNFGRRATSIALVGCTNRQEALRRIKIRQLSSLNETRQVSFVTNRQGCMVQPFSVILVADGDLASDTGIRTTGRLVANSGTTVTVRDTMRLEVGVSYKIHVTIPNPDYNPNSTAQPGSVDWRKPTITITRNVTNAAGARGDVTAIQIDSVLPAKTPTNAPIAFEAVDLPTLPKQYRVLDVEYQDEEMVSISAIEIYTNKWNESDSVNESDILAQRPNKTIPAPTVPEGGMFSVKTYPAEFQVKRVLSVTWERPGSIWIDGFKVEFNLNNGPWQTIIENTQDNYVELQQPQNGLYTFRITTVDRRGGYSAPLISTYQLEDTAADYAPVHTRGPLRDRPTAGAREGDKYTATDQTPNLTFIWSNGQWYDESTFVKDATDIKYVNPTTGETTVPVQDLMPAQAGADVTGQNTSKDTNAVAGTPATQVIYKLDDLTTDVSDLYEALGSSEGAQQYADAAQQYAQDALTAQTASQAARDVAQQAQTLASGSASAANTAKVDAQSAKTAAEAARDLANGSKTAAAGSAATASQAVTDANTAKTAAQTAATASQTSASNASGFATTASGQATIATQKADAAGTSASTATAQATIATTQAGNASTFASNAATSATNALGSANSASTQAGVAATSATQAMQTAASEMPSDFSQGDLFWMYGYQGNSDARPTNGGWTFPTVAGEGVVAQMVSTGARDIAHRGVTPYVAGRKYRVTVRAKGSSTNSLMYVYSILLPSQNGNAVLTPLLTLTALTTSFADYTFDFVGTTDAPYQRTLVRVSNNDGLSNTIQISRISLTDVTSEVAAKASATASATSASNAATSQSAAGTSATAANTSATNASTSAGQANTYANNASTSATNALGSANTATTQAGVAASSAAAASAASKATVPDNFADPSNWYAWNNWGGSVTFANGIANIKAGGSFLSNFTIPLSAGEYYRVTARHRTVNQGGGTTYIGTLVGGQLAWRIGAKPTAAVNQWEVSTFEISGNTIIAEQGNGTGVQIGLLTGYAGVSDAEVSMFRIENITAEVNARTSATAAAGSASTASASQTAAGQSASAAQASAATATTKAGEASTSSANAATSESNALGSKNAAASSASVAATARDDAVTAKNTAVSSASAAATSESNAAASKTDAGISATAAKTSETNAGTSAGTATTKASEASTSASNALGSANTATTQAGVAATSATQAVQTAASEMPSDFSQGELFWMYGFQGSSDVRPIAGGWTFPTVTGEGIVAQSVSTGARDIAHRSVTPLVFGRKYRATVRAKGSSAQSGLDIYNIIVPSQNVIATSTPLLGQPNLTTAFANYTYDFTPLAGRDPYQRILARAVSRDGSAQTIQISRIILEDVTSEMAAGLSASAAAGSASLASTKADAAGTSASAALASQTAANTSAGNASSSASQASSSATDALGSKNSAASSASLAATAKTDAQTAAGAAATSASNAAASKSGADTSASAASTSATNANTSAGQANTSAGQASTSASNAAGSASTASTAASTAVTARDTAQGHASAANTSAGSASGSATAAGNSATAANQSRLDAVAAKDSAVSSATAANTSAVNASNSASSAQQSATIASSYSSSSINTNDKFANWPDVAGYPSNYGLWASEGNFRKERAAPGIGSQYYVRTLSDAGGNQGFYQTVTAYPGKFVISATVMLDSGGSWDGAGLWLMERATSIGFASEADDAGVVSPTLSGQVRTWSKLVTVTANGNTNLHAMHGFPSGFGTTTAKYLRWYGLSIRPASAAEIAGNKALADSAANTASITSIQSTLTNGLGSLGTRADTLEAKAAQTSTSYIAVSRGAQGSGVKDSGLYTGSGARIGVVPGRSYAVFIKNPSDSGWFSQTYDVYGSQSARDSMANVLMNVGKGQIVVVVTSDEPNNGHLDAGLVAAMNRCGAGPVYAGSQFRIHGAYILVGVAGSGYGNGTEYYAGSTDTNPDAYREAGFNVIGNTLVGGDSKGALLGSVSARVSSAEGVLATVSGRTEAYAQKVVQAGMGAAFVTMRAKDDNGNYTSDVGIGASTISMYNQTTGGYKLTMQLSGGNALFTGSLNVGATIRLGSGVGWAVALQQRDFSLADGETVTYGVDLGNRPDFTIGNLGMTPLNSGEVYDVRMTNVTSTSATLYAKIVTAGSPTSYTSSNPTQPGSGPTLQANNNGQPNSTNGQYVVSATMRAASYPSIEDVGGARYWIDNVGYVDVWAIIGGAWVKVQTMAATFSGRYATGGEKSYTFQFLNVIVNVGTEASVLGITASGVETGRVIDVGMYPYGWSVQGTSNARSALPNGAKTTVTVRPK